MTDAERSSEDNGIWLCQNHAKLIDNDSETYPVDLLRAWRRLAEKRAHDDQEGGPMRFAKSERELAPHSVECSAAGDLRDMVFLFLENVGGSEAWGARAVRDVYILLVELALNAFKHGRASIIELRSDDVGVAISYAGPPFGAQDLRSTIGSGGRAALTGFEEHYQGTFVVTYRHSRTVNTWAVHDLVADPDPDSPCTISVEAPEEAVRLILTEEDRFKGCDDIHVYPSSKWLPSDLSPLLDQLQQSLPGTRVVVHRIGSDHYIAGWLAKKHPDIRFPD